MGFIAERRETKAIKQKLFIKKAMTNMNRIVEKLESQKELYILKARKAKQKGATSQVEIAKKALKMTMAYQKRAEEMLLQFDIAYQMKDLGDMTNQFMKGMFILSRDMQKLSKSSNFMKAQKKFEKAMSGMEIQSMDMEGFLEESKEIFENLEDEANLIDDKEIDNLIDIGSGELENTPSADNDIESRLDKVKKAMSEK